MRDQQRVLFNSVLGAKDDAGSLHAEAPFLTFADLLDSVRRISKELDGDPEALSGHTVQGWFKAGIIKPHHQDRTTRNRLYCAYDVIRVAAVFHIGHTANIGSEVAGVIADYAVEELDADFARFGTQGAPFDLSPTNYIVAITHHGRWAIECPKDQARFNLLLRRSSVTVLFNHNALIQMTWPILQEKWKQKAEWLLGVIKRDLAKKKPAKDVKR